MRPKILFSNKNLNRLFKVALVAYMGWLVSFYPDWIKLTAHGINTTAVTMTESEANKYILRKKKELKIESPIILEILNDFELQKHNARAECFKFENSSYGIRTEKSNTTWYEINHELCHIANGDLERKIDIPTGLTKKQYNEFIANDVRYWYIEEPLAEICALTGIVFD